MNAFSAPSLNSYIDVVYITSNDRKEATISNALKNIGSDIDKVASQYLRRENILSPERIIFHTTVANNRLFYDIQRSQEVSNDVSSPDSNCLDTIEDILYQDHIKRASHSIKLYIILDNAPSCMKNVYISCHGNSFLSTKGHFAWIYAFAGDDSPSHSLHLPPLSPIELTAYKLASFTIKSAASLVSYPYSQHYNRDLARIKDINVVIFNLCLDVTTPCERDDLILDVMRQLNDMYVDSNVRLRHSITETISRTDHSDIIMALHKAANIIDYDLMHPKNDIIINSQKFIEWLSQSMSWRNILNRHAATTMSHFAPSELMIPIFAISSTKFNIWIDDLDIVKAIRVNTPSDPWGITHFDGGKVVIDPDATAIAKTILWPNRFVLLSNNKINRKDNSFGCRVRDDYYASNEYFHALQSAAWDMMTEHKYYSSLSHNASMDYHWTHASPDAFGISFREKRSLPRYLLIHSYEEIVRDYKEFYRHVNNSLPSYWSSNRQGQKYREQLEGMIDDVSKSYALTDYRNAFIGLHNIENIFQTMVNDFHSLYYENYPMVQVQIQSQRAPTTVTTVLNSEGLMYHVALKVFILVGFIVIAVMTYLRFKPKQRKFRIH